MTEKYSAGESESALRLPAAHRLLTRFLARAHPHSTSAGFRNGNFPADDRPLLPPLLTETGFGRWSQIVVGGVSNEVTEASFTTLCAMRANGRHSTRVVPSPSESRTHFL